MNTRRRAPSGGRPRAFTLLELLICLAIASTLAALAVPGYRRNVLETRRIDAREALLRIQALQERHYFQHGRYAASLELLADPAAARSGAGHYRLETSASDDGQGFVARARADGAQARDRDCVELSLDDRGRRSARGVADAPERCWR